jgi:hypothetical protein
VYCNAFDLGYKLTSVTEVASADYSVIAESSGVHTVTITDLVPDTNYTTYCYTEDFFQHLMDLDDVLATQLNVSTDCCKQATFDLFVGTRLNDSTDTYSYVLDALPEVDTVFQVDVIATTNCTQTEGEIPAAAVAIPASTTFRADDLSTEKKFVIKGTPGCYNVTVTAISGSYYLGEEVPVVLMSSKNNPDAPVLESAQFGRNPSKILVVFDTPTDKAVDTIPAAASGSFPCTELFNSTTHVTVDGLSVSTCLWTTSQTLTITLGTGNPLTGGNAEIGDTLKILPNILNPCATCCPIQTQVCPAATSGEATISSPNNPLKPTPSLSTSATIGECADMRLDPTGSSGSGGRDWKTINWVVTGDGSQNATAVSLINSLLNSDYASTKKRAVIPSKWTDSGGTYTVKLQLTNFLNQYSQVSTTVTVTSVAKQPSVSIAGSKQVSMYRANTLILRAIGTVTVCSGASSGTNSIAYTWKVYIGSIYQSSIQSSSKDPRYFKLAAYTLTPNTVYTVYVTAALEGNSDTSSVRVSVGSAGVVASILGGSKRSGSTTTLVTFESGSYSIDYPTDDTAITYTWTCSEVSPNYGDDCPASLTGSTTPEATIAANAFTRAITASYAVSLFVSNTDGTATASASTEIEMVSSEIPEIAMGATETKYNPTKKIILSSTVTTIGDAWVTWASNEFNSTEWASRVLTSIQYQVPTGDTVAELAIRADSLVGGVTYTFVLSATYSADPNQIDKYEEISILMNEAPYGGTVISTPVNGTSLDTEFLFETADWNDDPDDIPLEYIISTYAESSSKTIVSTIGTTTYVETTCGQGLEDNDYQVYVEVEAYDIYGAMASTLTNITVSPLDASLLTAAADSALETAFANSDPVAVSSVINAVSAALNVVNCTVPTPCASLNRDVCVKTPKTCGECLSGYLGVDGDANKMCSDPTALRKIGAACTTDANCITDYCHPTDLVCSELDKTCKDDCSGNGNCVFVSVTNGATLSACAQSDTTCYAECQDCATGYFGATCGLTQANFDSNVALRETLCKSIYDTVDIQDITEDVMKSRSSTLSGLLLDPTQLSTYSIANCTAALVRTVELAPEYAGLDDVSDLVAETLSGVLGLDLNTELLANVSETLKSLTSSVQDNLAVGEAQKAFNTDNARIGAEVVDPNAVSGTSFGPPQTDTEVFNAAPITNFSLVAGASVSAMGVSVVQYKNNPTGSVTDNTPIGVQTTNYAAAGRRRRRLRQHLPESVLTATYGGGGGVVDEETNEPLAANGRRRRLQTSSNTVNLEMQNNGDVTYIDIAEYQGWINCSYQDAAYTQSVDCNALNETTFAVYQITYTMTCPAEQTANFSYTCPAVQKLPKCQTYDGADFTEDTSCTLVSYTNRTTVCECDVDSSRRRLSLAAASQSELKQFTATAGVLSNSFTQTMNVLNYDDDLATPTERFTALVAGNTVIFAVMMTIVVISIGGVILTGYKDRGDIGHWKHHLKKTEKIREKVLAMRTIKEFINDALPIEYSGMIWTVRFKQRLIENHDWISCFLPFRESGSESWATFTKGMGKLVNFLFVDTILAGLFFADDGSCQSYTTEEDCTFLRALSQVESLCSWEFDYEGFYNATVYYNVPADNPIWNDIDLRDYYGSCSFGTEGKEEFIPTLILVVVISIFSIPFNIWIDFIVDETVALFSVNKAVEREIEEEVKAEVEADERGHLEREGEEEGGHLETESTDDSIDMTLWQTNHSQADSDTYADGSQAGGEDDSSDAGSANLGPDSPWCNRSNAGESEDEEDEPPSSEDDSSDDDSGSDSPWRHNHSQKSHSSATSSSNHISVAASATATATAAAGVTLNEVQLSEVALRDHALAVEEEHHHHHDDPHHHHPDNNWHRQHRHHHTIDGTVPSNHQVYAATIDNLQTRAGTIMRAARLVRMQETMDDVDSDTETEIVLRNAADKLRAGGGDVDGAAADATVNKEENDYIMRTLTRWYVLRTDHGSNDIAPYVEGESIGKYTGVVKTAVQKARCRCDDICEQLKVIEDESEQDIFLLRRFIVDSLSSYQRNVAKNFLGVSRQDLDGDDDDDDDDEANNKRSRWRYFCFVALVAHFFFMCLYVFLFGVRLGPAGVSIWLTGAGLTFMQATLILQPLNIFVYFVAISGMSAERVRTVHALIREKLTGVLRRTSNVMSGSNSLVQHLNPACRAARKFPHLRMSRVLMSLNDYDVPVVHFNHQRSSHAEVVKVIWRGIAFIVFVFLIIVVMLPGIIGDALMEVGTNLAFNFSLAFMYSLSLVGTVALPVCLALLLTVYIVYMDKKNTKRLHETKWSLERPVEKIDVEEIVNKKMVEVAAEKGSLERLDREIYTMQPNKSWKRRLSVKKPFSQVEAAAVAAAAAEAAMENADADADAAGAGTEIDDHNN